MSFRLVTSGFASISLCLMLGRAAPGQTKPPAPAIERGIVYATQDGEELKLDLCKPADTPGATLPPRAMVVCVHGGGWVAGDRVDQHRQIVRLAKEGFVAVSISYRFAPKHPYPAPLDDVKAALRFVRSKASDWNIDPERVAVLGESAGGHLSLLAGLMPSEPDTKVRAVVNYCGPTDFVSWKPTIAGEVVLAVGLKRNSADILKAFLGADDRAAAIMKKASPITYVTRERAKECPPILTLQGTADPIVPDQQARLLHKALDAAGVPNRLVLLDGAGHGWSGAERDRTDRADVEFLKKWLGK